jgi:hypothetical protein
MRCDDGNASGKHQKNRRFAIDYHYKKSGSNCLSPASIEKEKVVTAIVAANRESALMGDILRYLRRSLRPQMSVARTPS